MKFPETSVIGCIKIDFHPYVTVCLEGTELPLKVLSDKNEHCAVPARPGLLSAANKERCNAMFSHLHVNAARQSQMPTCLSECLAAYYSCLGAIC